jgi:hypothetical protein
MNIWSAGVINLIHAYDPEIVVREVAFNSKEEIGPYPAKSCTCMVPLGQSSDQRSSGDGDTGVFLLFANET